MRGVLQHRSDREANVDLAIDRVDVGRANRHRLAQLVDVLVGALGVLRVLGPLTSAQFCP